MRGGIQDSFKCCSRIQQFTCTYTHESITHNFQFSCKHIKCTLGRSYVTTVNTLIFCYIVVRAIQTNTDWYIPWAALASLTLDLCVLPYHALQRSIWYMYVGSS